MSNPWISFEKLISEDKRIIAKVISTNSTTGRVNTLPVGSSKQIYVESNGVTYNNESYVFIKGGIIIGVAPNIRNITTELLS